MITEATPITTPIKVRMERSLLPHRDCSASLKASISFIASLFPRNATYAGNEIGFRLLREDMPIRFSWATTHSDGRNVKADPFRNPLPSAQTGPFSGYANASPPVPRTVHLAGTAPFLLHPRSLSGQTASPPAQIQADHSHNATSSRLPRGDAIFENCRYETGVPYGCRRLSTPRAGCTMPAQPIPFALWRPDDSRPLPVCALGALPCHSLPCIRIRPNPSRSSTLVAQPLALTGQDRLPVC